MAWFLYPLYNMLRLNSTRPIMLGRWCPKTNKHHEDVVTFWANSDHCGDVICGNPIENKKILDGKPVFEQQEQKDIPKSQRDAP